MFLENKQVSHSVMKKGHEEKKVMREEKDGEGTVI